MKNYNALHLAYLAGIVDGEGSIYIGNFSSNPKTGVKYYQTAIEINNTAESLIDWLVENFGGRKYNYTPKQLPKNSRKQVFRWIANGQLVTDLCHAMRPYLVIKGVQCDIMIEMRKTYDLTGSKSMKKGQQGVPSLPMEIQEKRQALMDKIQSLHCRKGQKK